MVATYGLSRRRPEPASWLNYKSPDTERVSGGLRMSNTILSDPRVSNNQETPIRILLVDDHTMFRDGLARMLEKESDFTVTGQAGSATEGLAVLLQGDANLVLL